MHVIRTGPLTLWPETTPRKKPSCVPSNFSAKPLCENAAWSKVIGELLRRLPPRAQRHRGYQAAAEAVADEVHLEVRRLRANLAQCLARAGASDQTGALLHLVA